ncbi:peptidoglycan-binding protein [Candidatus Pacearchaeota archaeon]|nr:peptidoglycan-binding protein [Candidatus Pacearchaeota archaeon]
MKTKLKNILLIVTMIVLNAILIQALPIGEIFDPTNSKGINADLENSMFTFSEPGGALYIIGNDGNMHTYSNILPATENIKSFIKLDLDGSIESLDLTASDKTSIYINGAYLPLEKGSRVIYDSENGVPEVISKSNSVMNIPTFSENVFQSTPKEIMYTSLGGAELTLSKDYILKDGSLKYSLNDKQFYVPKGKFSVLNDFKIDAQSKNVLLGKDVKFSGNSLHSSGSGFKLSFNPGVSTSSTGEVPISLSNAKNGKYFYNGDTGDDVKNIQRIVGVIPTGNYDKITEQAVIKWQAENGLASDGKFGKNSLEKANYIYNFDLSKSSNGKSFKLGDKGEDVKSIQSMLISQGYLSKTFTNAYGKEVSSIDGYFGFRTENALKEWQRKNGLNPNGIFEETSSKKATKLSKETINLNMMGGSSTITNGRNGLDIAMKGRGSLEIAGKKYLFEGGELKENLRTSLESTSVSTPITVKYTDNEGRELKLDLISPENKIGNVELARSAKALGLDVKKVVCSGGAQIGCLLVEEEYGGGIKLTNQGDAQKYLRENGVHGDAWEIQYNMLKQGGGIIYSREYELTPEERTQLNEIEAKLKKDYNRLKKLRLSDEAIFNTISTTNSESINKMRSILGKDHISQQITPQKGDIVSFYYPPSNYLTQATIEGKNNQKNTHVGVIVGSNEHNLIIKGESERAFAELKERLKVKNDDSMYVNTYNYIDEKTGYVKPLTLKDKKFYTEDGKELSFGSGKEILISTPVVSDFVGGKFNVRELKDVLDQPSYSLYGVTRPKSSQYLNELFITPDLVTTYQNHVNCNTISCTGFNLEEVLRANNVKKYTDWNQALLKSSAERQKEYNIPDSKFNEFNALTATIITKESNWGDSKWYALESTLARTRLDKAVSKNPTLGYMQINTADIEKYAKQFDEKTPSAVDMYRDKELSIKYGQRYLAELVNIYSPTPGGMTENQVKSITAAYNFGRYTPRNAAIQAQLKELGYYNAKADGLWGGETERAIFKFAKERKLKTISSSTFYSKSFEESDIYHYIKEEYLKKTNKNPEYSLVPDWVGETAKTKAHSISQYADSAYEIYTSYCPNCA